MKFQYQISRDENLIRLTCSGDISIDEVIDHMNRVHKDPDFRTGMNTIADLSGARLEMSFMEINCYKEFVQKIESVRGNCKWAFYAPHSATHEPDSLFNMVFESSLIDVRLFKDKAEAELWVNSGLPK